MEPSGQNTAQPVHSSQPAAGVHEQRPIPAQHRTATPVPAVPVARPAQAQAGLALPYQIVSRSDVSRCLRELQGLDDYFHQAAVRGSRVEQLPQISAVLESVVNANGLNLLHAEHREALKPFLSKIRNSGPVVHLGFPSTASAQFVSKLLQWFRTEAHPHTMLHIGLQPELAAGFVVRTTNKAFDFSFRKRFDQSKQKLIVALEKMGDAPEKTVVAGANDTVAPEAQLGSEGQAS